MSGNNKDEGKPTNGEEIARKSRKAGSRRKKRVNNGTVNHRTDDSPTTDIDVNGVFLKSIRPEDTKALKPAEWEAVRDYVLNERKKLAGKNGPTAAVDAAGNSDKCRDNDATKSPPENASKNVAAKNNRSKKKQEVKVKSAGPTNVTINDVFLKSIWPDDTKALTPADWELVRDYVMHERKKLAGKNAHNDDRNVSQLDSASTKTVSEETAPAAGDSVVQSSPENTSASTDAKKANKNNRSKKKNGRNGGKDANSMEPVEDSVIPVVDEHQNSSSNNRRAKTKGKSNSSRIASNTSSQNGVSTKQKAEAEKRLVANEQAKIERDRADGLAKQVTFLGQELKRVTKDLEKSKHEAKRHLIIQQQLLVVAKKDLSTVNASLCLEHSKVAKLNDQLVLEMAAKESCAKELERIKEVVASERKKVEDLREELNHTKTARDSMEQELNDNKLRAERVKKLEIELREERAKIAKLGNPSSKATVTLRKELHDTQEKLKKAKKRNEVLTSELSAKNYPQRQQQTGYISQREQKGPDGEATGKISLKAALPKRTTSMPAPVEVSLSERASLVNFESAPVHYDGVDDHDGDDGQSSGPVQDELAFIRSAFSSHEISVDDKQVIYTLQLPMDNDSGDVRIDISVTLPIRYPSIGVNEIKVAMNEKSTCSPEMRKIALDALPTLQEICLIEARAREGSIALLSIFSVADMWAKDDWYAVMAKQLSHSKGKGKPSSKTSGGKGSFEFCAFLIYTHHIVDPDKIQLVKKSASKLNLGGYIKIGRPGLILVEGSQPDCEALLETLLLNRKKLRERGGKNFDTATFSPAGKMQRYDNERQLPKKLEQLEAQDGMDEIKDACRKLGLLDR
eukprot:CAMPEP_0183740262 /NCGR_PEP_ID=MMETSP0737-20130205/59107_1 /TAXON_ID=385413 /ORGANISM="Thalassiosira miniscula, Strain CCMP1093" /LENGTH=853 /DNA_ID=CAMNT_0025975265 /DNA_START=26 /DNA_END=2587 /DNA_ORIENTATION=+